MRKPLSHAERRALEAARRRASIQSTDHNMNVVPRSERQPIAPVRPGKRSLFLKIITVVFLALLIGSGIFGYKIISASDSISDTDRSILGQLKDLLFSSNETLLGEEDNRVNIMLIAIGGSGHKGENLADSIMVASIRPQNNQAALLSIPRDLYVQVPGEEYYSKINAVHAYGESQKEGQGPHLLKEKVEEITGLPIHYYIRIDFTAFKGIVDAVGGININIENSFYDYWHKISFPAGTEKMNGERALAYARARYIEGSEGGDFKRAARQQQLLLALREKVFSVQTAIDFSRTNSILNSLSDNIRTDLQLWEMKRFYELARLLSPDQVNSTVLTTGPHGVLTGDTEVLGGTPASVLKPRTGDYSEIHNIADNLFTIAEDNNQPTNSSAAANQTPSPTATATPTPTPETKPTLEIRNGTNITGLAGRTRDRLEQAGYEVISVGNATSRDFTTTNLYVISESGQSLADELSAELNADLKSELPAGETGSNAEILIILGSGSDDTE